MPKILLIDDEPDIVRVLSMSLRADGYEVVTAHSGEEGLNIFEKEEPEVVLTDIKMPGMDGIEVLRRIKESRDEPEVIIITGHGDIDSAIEALQLGASDFINKPVRDKALAISLQRALDKIAIKRQLKEYTLDLESKIEVATRELRRQSNFQFKLIRSSNDGIIATDQNLRIVIYNPGAEIIFGYRPEEVINRKEMSDLYPPELTDSFVEAMTGKAKAREFPWAETSIVSRSGEQIPVRFSGSILFEKNKEMGSVAFFQDLREIKRLERELLRSERLAAIGQTVTGLAHGIKNILHGLKGGSYLVDVGLKKNDMAKLKDGWASIKRNIDRTSDLVMDLLTYSKERQPVYENCYPNEIAGDVKALLEEKAREGDIKLEADLDERIGRVRLDPRTLHRALLNLATNAVDACLFDEDTHKNWHVTIRSRLEQPGLLRFEVSDNGAGMSEEVKGKLFKAFFSTKGHRGTGLGLMNTYKMVEEHEGTITVESTLGKGTTFTIDLPFKEAEDRPSESESPAG